MKSIELKINTIDEYEALRCSIIAQIDWLLEGKASKAAEEMIDNLKKMLLSIDKRFESNGISDCDC